MMESNDSALVVEGMDGAMALGAAALVTSAVGKLEVRLVDRTLFGAERKAVPTLTVARR